MKNKRLLLGDQAIALGAIHAGISGCMLIRELPLLKLRNIFKTLL